MKLTGKFISVLMSIMLILNTFAGAIVTKAANYEDKTVILVTSNLRGDINTLAKIKSVKESYIKNGADVILADSGNFLQGSIYSHTDKGYSMFCLMEKAGYDVVNLGTYDFAFGDALIKETDLNKSIQFFTQRDLVEGGTACNSNYEEVTKSPTNIKVISSNTTGYNPNYSFSENAILDTRFGTICFVGLTNPNVVNTIVNDTIEGLSFNDSYDTSEIDTDLIITLANFETKADIAVNENLNTSVRAIVIDNKGNRTIENINLSNYYSDKELKTESEKIRVFVNSTYPNVAKTKHTLNYKNDTGLSFETNFGDLWTDALRDVVTSGEISKYFSDEYLESHGPSIDVDEADVVSIWNSNKFNNCIYAGEFIKEDLQFAVPRQSDVAISYLTGEQLEEALEATLQIDDSFACVSGIEYIIDETVPFQGDVKYNNSRFYIPDSNCIYIKSINGQPFDLEKTYAVVTSNAISNGVFTYCVFKEKQPNSTVSNLNVVDAVWNYIEDKLDGCVGNEYAKSQNRVTIGHNEIEDNKLATTNTNGHRSTICTICGCELTKKIIYYPKTVELSTTKYTYDGKEKKPSVKVTDSNGKIITSANYKLSYPSGRKNVGKYTITLTFKGDYSGTKTVSFIINPKNTSGLALSAQKAGFKASWKKQATQTTGYQLQYSTTSDFKSPTTVSITKNTTLSKSITKLKTNKKYYVRIRTYKTVNNTKYYSNWSSSKSITTKK